MDFSIASILLLDGVTNGAVYALLAMATVLLFAVTRVIFIPQGEFVAFGALTVGMFQAGQVPGTVWLLLAMAVAVAVLDTLEQVRQGKSGARITRHALLVLALPVLTCTVAWWIAPSKPPLFVAALLTLLLVTPMGP